ncbi:MAG TPA: heme ABC transporter permease [Candidatus Sulfotelmatobacter sp.]|nr:heme ABC transporter permease [Candidatus Sulfotelmatobacter sp.]
MHRFANPTRVLRIAGAVLPWSAALAVVLLGTGLYYALIASPIDYQQKDTVRIMYIHVPAAFMAMGGYALVAVASAVALIWRHPVADLTAKAAAPIGAGFTFVCLVTGSLWGQPTWGTWWVWDARLTSVLILFFLYIGYIAIWEAYDDPSRAARAAAILALVGSVNLPIIHYSVVWWNTLHQGPSLSLTGSSIDPSMLRPLLLMAGGFAAYFVTVLIYRLRAEILARRLRTLRLAQAAG